jgi:phosphoketolase
VEEVTGWYSRYLVEAILAWTGYGENAIPRRDASVVIARLGEDVALKLLSAIKVLEDEFYASDARFKAVDLMEMERMASDQFIRKHPNIDARIVKALAWCYTFDYK